MLRMKFKMQVDFAVFLKVPVRFALSFNFT